MKYATILLPILAATLTAGTAAAQSPCRLAPDTIALGDQTLLSGPFSQIAGQDIVVVRIVDDSATHTRTAVLTCFEPGEHFVQVGDADSLPLMVTDVAVDTASTELRDIAPIQRVPYTFWEVFRWVLLALAVAAAVWCAPRLVAWWRRRHPAAGGTAAPADNRPPDVRALEALEALRRRQLWQAGLVKEYHTDLTDIVRRFIEESSGIRATELTSAETLDLLEASPWQVDYAPLRYIFNTADLVKFAKSQPLAHEHERSLREATAFVQAFTEATLPQPADQAPAATATETATEEEGSHE